MREKVRQKQMRWVGMHKSWRGEWVWEKEKWIEKPMQPPSQAAVIEQTREFLTSPEAPLLERGMKLTYTEKSKGEERANNYRLQTVHTANCKLQTPHTPVLSSRMQGKERERERERERKRRNRVTVGTSNSKIGRWKERAKLNTRNKSTASPESSDAILRHEAWVQFESGWGGEY